MNRTPLARVLLSLSLILGSAAPVLSAFEEAPAPKGSGPVIAVSAAVSGDPYAAALSKSGRITSLPVLSQLESLKTVQPGSAAAELAGLVRQAALNPELRADPAVRAAISQALGTSALSELDEAGARVDKSGLGAVARQDERKAGAKAVAARIGELKAAFSVSFPTEDMPTVAGAWGAGSAALIKGKSASPSPSVKAVERTPFQPVINAGRSLMRKARVGLLAMMMGMGAVTAVPQLAIAQPQHSAQMQVQQDRVIEVRSLAELKAQWSPDHSIYVVGDFGGTLSQDDLRDLAAKLKGRHWTIVLFPNFSGQSFTDKDGSTHYGREAVEYFLSQTIESDGRFQAQKDALGESDAKIWFWGRDEKFRNYIGSEAENKRGLSTREYENMGPLDAPWLRQMRQNRDVVRAVDLMTENIDDQLKSAVDNEIADAGTQTRSAADKVAELSRAAADLARANPAAAKAAGSFDVAGLKAKADRAQAALSANQPAKALQLAGEVVSAADSGLSRINGVQGAFTSATNNIAQAEASVADLDAKTASFRKSLDHQLGGDIGSAQLVSDLRAKVKSAKSSLAAGRADEAGTAAKDVAARAAAAVSAMESYANAGTALDEAATRLAKVQKDEYANDARTQILSAKQALSDAQTAYRNGESTYQQSLQSAQSAVKSAETVVSDARAAHARAVATFWGSLIALLLGLLTLGGLLNFRARKPRKETTAELATWESILTDEQTARYTETNAEVKRWIGEAATDFNYEGETARIADEARVTFDIMRRLWEKAKTTIERAESLAKPSPMTPRWFWNQFFPGNFKKALESLKTPLEFLPDEGLDLKLGLVRSSALKDKLGKAAKGKEYNFTDVMSLYDDMKDAVTQAFTGIKTAKAQVTPELDRIDGLIKGAAAQKAALDTAGKDDGFFLVPSLFSDLLPAAAKTVAEAREKVAKDPVGALSKYGSKAQAISEYAANLSDAILSARTGSLGELAKSETALKAGGVKTDWIDDSVKDLSGAAEKLASEAVSASKSADGKPDLAKVAQYSQKVAAAAARGAQAAKHNETLNAVAYPSLSTVAAAVLAARNAISKALGLEPKDILTESETADMDAEISAALEKKAAEKGAALHQAEIADVMKEIHSSRTLEPGAKLALAKEQADKAKAFLDKGQIENAAAALDAAGEYHDVAAAILEKTQAAFDAQDATVKTRSAETKRLQGLVGAAEAALTRIRKTYAESVLKLGAGDAGHPGADDTVDNNVDEVNDHIAQASDKTSKAVASFKEGKILRAASLLDQAAAHQELAQARLDEVSEKEARLTAAVAANKASLAELDGRLRAELDTAYAEARTMKPTLSAIDQARKDLESARQAVQKAKGDPFAAQSQLAAVKAAFDKIKGLAQNDKDLHGHATSTVSSAGAAMESARQQARAAKAEPGSGQDAAITKSLRDLDQLEVRFQKAQGGLTVQHGDWNALDHEAGEVAGAASRIASALREEVAEADAAQAAINNAASQVRTATGWSGSYGVTVPGSPGSGSLSSARSALNSGDYERAKREAQAAYSAAAAAIAAAEEEVARQRRAEEERRRREEEERRRRQEEEEERERRSRESSSSGGGFGGGGSSWGGGSSGGFGGGGSSFGGGSSGGY